MTAGAALVERVVRGQQSPPVDLFVAESGPAAGPRLLVIHGGPDWDHTYLLEPLVALRDHRVIFVDLRGCGRSTKGLGEAAYTPEHATNDLVVLLGEIGKVDVLGFSYGGLIAQRLAVAAAAQVRRLIIASSSVLPTVAEDDEEPRPSASSWTPEDTRALALETAPRDLWRNDRLPQYLQRLEGVRFSAEWSRPWLAGTLPSARRDGAADVLALLGKPTLLLQGLHDSTFPAQLVAPTLAAVPSATAVVLDDAGHMAHVDEPQLWLRAVQEFLSQRSVERE